MPPRYQFTIGLRSKDTNLPLHFRPKSNGLYLVRSSASRFRDIRVVFAFAFSLRAGTVVVGNLMGLSAQKAEIA